MLDQPSAELRAWAAAALSKLGPAAQNAVPVLIQKLKDPSPEVRPSAALELGIQGAPPRTRSPILAQC